MMKKLFYLFIASSIFISCEEEINEKPVLPDSELPVTTNSKESFENRVASKIKLDLSIPANEKYDVKIYKAHLNNDSIEDAIITVNRLEHAIAMAKESGRYQKQADINFWGDYNYMYYYDGQLDQISPPLPVISSATSPLEISFEHLKSEYSKDIIVDYKTKNAGFRKYFIVLNHAPQEVFQWKVYDGIHSDKKEACCFTYDKGSYSNAKDIIIKSASFNEDPTIDYSIHAPLIECGNEIIHRFFYDVKTAKYYTKKGK